MNFFDLMPPNSTGSDWLMFLAIMVPLCLGIGGFVIWFVLFRKSHKKRERRRRHKHHRKLNPTLAQTEGLPPLRPPNKPPRGV